MEPAGHHDAALREESILFHLLEGGEVESRGQGRVFEVVEAILPHVDNTQDPLLVAAPQDRVHIVDCDQRSLLVREGFLRLRGELGALESIGVGENSLLRKGQAEGKVVLSRIDYIS
jgi:hypothetical protein